MEAVAELIRILDRQAVVIHHVLHRLKAIELLLTADEHRFLSSASDELLEVLDRLATLETMRALVAEEIGEAVGAQPGEVRLLDALRVADDRQRGLLVTAQIKLRALTEELEAQTGLDRDMALARIAQARASLDRLGASSGGRYGQDGLVRDPAAPISFDQRF